jgi:hypothetical protein
MRWCIRVILESGLLEMERIVLIVDWQMFYRNHWWKWSSLGNWHPENVNKKFIISLCCSSAIVVQIQSHLEILGISEIIRINI